MALSSSDVASGEGTRTDNCPRHGDFESRSIARGRVWSRCPVCGREQEQRLEAEAAERTRLAAKQRHEHRLDIAGVPARFLGRDFRAYQAQLPAQMRALAVVRDFAEQFGNAHRLGRGLVLFGMPGTGKTMLAIAAVQALLDEWSVRYLTCMELVGEVRAAWGRRSSTAEGDTVRHLASLDLLVIDEIGASFGSNSEKTIVFDVLDRRYREMLPTILITNEDADGLKACIGDRAFDRLVETSRWVAFDWASHRGQGQPA